MTSGSSLLTSTISYYDTGNINLFKDANGGQTTYSYHDATSTCGNAFPTSVTLPVTPLSRGYAWNCAGAVTTTYTDENQQPWSTTYADTLYGRPTMTTDPAGTATTLAYNTSPVFSVESALNFNGSTSTVDALLTLDSLGRPFISQRKQSASSSNYDTVETDYDAQGRVAAVTVPYTGTASCSYKTTPSCTTNSTVAVTTTTYDGLNRPLLVTDGGRGTTNYTYNQNDMLVNVGPAPSWQRQLEYDGSGRLTSVCELSTTLSGSGNCAQTTSQAGFWTQYAYDALNDLLTVAQNAQSGTPQTRTYTYDGIGRMTSEKNPETNGTAYAYSYDTDTNCGTSSGDLVKRTDALSPTTVTCYAYDALHRLTSVTYPSGGYSSVTPPKYYVYDSATVNGQGMANTANRLAEAYTGTNTSKVTDLGFSYTNRGEVRDVWESTPHSGSYYHGVASYWVPGPIGLLNTLNPNISHLPTWTYTPDGEGRANSISASSGQSPLSSVQYNEFSEAMAINYGSGDSDILGYDPKTGRMTGYQQNVGTNGLSLTGSPTWNLNGTLQSLNVTDQFLAGNTQNCGYTYDDLARLGQVDCGAGKWAQTFTYDPFGNIAKSVPNLPGGRTGQSFNPVYNGATNQYSSLTGVTPPYYDGNGNVTSDGFHHYAWDAEGKMSQIDSGASSWTFDALGRWVERADASGNYVQAVYDPTGNLLAQMINGQTLRQGRLPLVAGAAAQYAYNGGSYEPSWGTLSVYWHPDWLGTSRLESTPFRGVSADPSMAPFGEQQWVVTAFDSLFVSMDATQTVLVTYDSWPLSAALPFVIQIDNEEMLVTDIGLVANYAADGYTVVRGWNGTSPAAHNAHVPISLVSAATVFTGNGFQDKAADLADFPYREYHSIQGRWISPDPAGLAAVDLTNPQSWNRYAYALNNPLKNIDPSGLLYCAPASPDGSNDGQDAPDCVSDEEYNGDPGLYSGWLQVVLTQSVTVTDTQDYVDYQSSLMGLPSGLQQVPGLEQSPYAQAATRMIGAKLNQFPTLCGGGVYVYAGKELSMGPAHGFAGAITEFDTQSGVSKGALFELGGGEGAMGGAGYVGTVGANGQAAGAGLVYAGAGASTPVAAGSVGLVGFGSGNQISGIGLYGEGFLFGRGGGAGVYANVTSAGSCGH